MKKTRLVDIIRKVVNEQLELESQASDAAKQQGLEYMAFGRWGKDGKVTHTTQGGKLVPLKTMDPGTARLAKAARPAFGDRSPEAQKRRNQSQDTLGQEPFSGDVQIKSDNPAARKLVDKIHDKVNPLGSPIDLGSYYGYYRDIPADQVEQDIGLTKKAMKWYSDNVQGYDKAFDYDADTDTVSFRDPADV
jgi:hypothetical protein